MRKFLSLIFALFVTLPFCTKCYAKKEIHWVTK